MYIHTVKYCSSIYSIEYNFSKPLAAPVVKMISFSFLTILFLTTSAAGQKGKCQLDDRVKLALKTMSDSTVPAVVDCVVDLGACDHTGDWIKNHAV